MMKKPFPAILLSLCMVLALIPAMAFAEALMDASEYYTVTYDPGAYGKGSIAADTQIHGKYLTLTSETFTREGCVQIGWALEDGCYYWNYELGDIYSEDEDVTLYPVWEERVTMTTFYTTTVKQGGDIGPRKTDFMLKLMKSNGESADLDGVTVSGLSVTTNGAGDWNGSLTFSGLSWKLWEEIADGVFVQQVDAGEEGWEYDPTVWFVVLDPEHGLAARSLDDAAPLGYRLYVYPAHKKGTEYDWDDDANPVEKMTFQNTYTMEAPDISVLPKTGDSSNLAAWLVLLAVSAAGVTGAVVYGKRRRSARE